MTDEVAADQAPPQSVTDRIASKFGFPGQKTINQEAPAEASESGETAPESELAELDWGGEKYHVPAKLKDAFMKNEDYTRKTQELAEQRRAVEHRGELYQQRQVDEAFHSSIAPEVQELHVIDAYLQQVGKVDASTMSMEQMFRHKMEVDQVKERRTAIKASVDEKRSKFNDEVKAKITELRSKAKELAAKKIPGFSEEVDKEIRAYARSEDLADSEIDNVMLDARSTRIMWKAAQFDKIKAGTQSAADKATKAGPVLKPGVAGERMPASTVSKLNLAKALKNSTSSGEKARAIEDHLARGIFAKGHT